MKLWKPGTADEAWKVAVCALAMRDSQRALEHLIYVLTDAGNDRERGLAMLREMSGAEIVDGMLAHIDSAAESIAKGLKG